MQITPRWRGIFETVVVIGGFVAFGLFWAALESDLEPGGEAYAHPMAETTSKTPRIWLVDGYNTVCAGLLGGRDRTQWWSRQRRAELLQRLAGFEGLAAPSSEIWVVFDGASPAQDDETGSRRIRSVFFPSADEWLVREVRDRANDGGVAVVTDDRRLANRARDRGALILTPQEFLRCCPKTPPADEPPV